MDELVTRLESTTPSVAAPNLHGIRRRARVRRGRRWAVVALPLAGLTASAIALSPMSGHHVTTAGAPEPTGTWRQASPPPLDLTSQVRTITLSDSQLVVVAGSFDVDMPAHRFETAMYDVNTDRWTRLADAPVTPPAGGADLLAANDHLLLVTHDDAGDVSVARFDGTSRQWQAIPMPGGDHVFEGWAWDGKTLALARLGLSPYGDPSSPAAIERWNATNDTWQQGAKPPLAARYQATVAHTPNELAVWGGATFDQQAPGSVARPVTAGTPTTVGSHSGGKRAFIDGAVYDVEHDVWTYLPPDPALTEMAARGAGSVLSSSVLTLVSSQIEGSPRIAMRYEHGDWHQLPSPSAAGGMFARQETGTIAIATADESGRQGAQYIDGTGDAWRPAPAYAFAQGDHGLIATSATMDGPLGASFTVWRLDGGTWTAASPAPFPNRMEPGIGVVGNRVLVIGGQDGPNLERHHDAWVLDFS